MQRFHFLRVLEAEIHQSIFESRGGAVPRGSWSEKLDSMTK